MWTHNLPAAGATQALSIQLHEPLDHVLAQNAMQVKDAKANTIDGKWEVNEQGTVVSFTPTVSWKPGSYSLRVESRMEDLAGNNLNHLFDADLTQKQKVPKDFYTRSFIIK